jgi:RHS repeat-associated protein
VSASPGYTLNSFTPVTGADYDNLNHMNASLGRSAIYNPGGNQTQIGAYGNQYDAENRMTSSSIGGGTATYSYDGQGRRVMKQSGGITTVYVYDAKGELTQEYANGTVSTPLCYTCYLMADHLGSTRLMLDSSGNIVTKHDYLPFGEEILQGTDGRDATWGGSDPRQKFTSKERDAESGLDYFGARYMSSAQGRFTSPDPSRLSAFIDNPQTWNMYSYARITTLWGWWTRTGCGRPAFTIRSLMRRFRISPRSNGKS